MLKQLISRIKAIPYKFFLFGPYLIQEIGSGLNHIVMVANGGQMPVKLPWLPIEACTQEDFGHDFIHTCLTSHSHLKWLADIWTEHHGIFSLGDMLLDVSDFTLWPCLIIWATLMIYKHTTQNGS